MSKVIVEIGSNHMADFEKGKQLIDDCLSCGCNLFKMQLWKADDLYMDTPIYHVAKSLELSEKLATKFYDYCIDNDAELFFSPFNEEAIDFCQKIGVSYYKIAARNQSLPLIEKISNTCKPTFVSFDRPQPYSPAVKKMQEHFNADQMIPLYTVSQYPPKENQFSIPDLEHIISKGGGYSNHYKNILYPLIADRLGAAYIELHVKSEKFLDTPDAVCSLTIKQLTEFMEAKNVE